MHINILFKHLLFIIPVMFLMACVPAGERTEPLLKLVWPPAPAQARVAYDQAFGNADDLGIKKGFWQRLGEFIVGREDINMIRPMAVVTNAKGVIFVADPGVRGIHRFDLDENQYDLIRLNDDRELPSPVALAIDQHGNVFVSDSELGKIFRIATDARYAVELKLDTELKQPTGLALDAEHEYLYVVDTAQHEVLIFKNDQLLKRFGQRGKGNGEFNFPTMIWRHADGTILVTDSLNFRIQMFDAEGRFLGKFGELGDASGSQTRPKGVATDQAGRIYVVDSLFHNIQIFDMRGQFLLDMGEQGAAAGQFWLPTGIYINALNKIYVADSYNSRIQVFRYIGAEQ